MQEPSVAGAAAPPAAGDEPVLLEARGLAAHRGHAVLFERLTFVLPRGGLVAVMGANGTGKTTLLRLAAGLAAPFAGTLLWRGHPIAPFDLEHRGEVAYLGHAAALKDELTAAENLHTLAALHGRNASSAAIDEALARMGLGAQRRLPARVLSQGQRRRLGLARLALSSRPLWVLDEPASMLDAAGILILRDMLEEHLSTGGGALVATHHPLELARGTVQRLDLA